MSELAPRFSPLQVGVPTSNRRPILIIEDDPAIADIICRTLEIAGYQAMVCTDRKAALTWINRALEGGSLPALILLDVGISPTNGIGFLSVLRKQFSQAHCTLPEIILLTTSKAIQADFSVVERVVLKPFHVRDLMAEVKRVFPLS